MKYLKIFEEFNQQGYIELLDFCESNLIYLIDEGWRLDINITFKKKNSVYIKNEFYRIQLSSPTSGYDWEDIKDVFIPFFNRLESEYELVPEMGRSLMGRYELRKNDIYISGRGIISKEIEDINDKLKIGLIEIKVRGRIPKKPTKK
jgi:hypothetical protein